MTIKIKLILKFELFLLQLEKNQINYQKSLKNDSLGPPQK